MIDAVVKQSSLGEGIHNVLGHTMFFSVFSDSLVKPLSAKYNYYYLKR